MPKAVIIGVGPDRDSALNFANALPGRGSPSSRPGARKPRWTRS